MDAASTQDALDLFLEGYKISPLELEEFIQKFQEDQHLDYKDGAITSKDKSKHGRKIIREQISGFANSDGGVLIIGITDKPPREISPCIPPGAEPLDKWAEAHLLDISPRLSPLPRIQIVDHPKGPVLIIAVARAGEIVPVVEANRQKYFLRFNQSTIEAPPFLISDLILGRRQHPVIEMEARVAPPHPVLNARGEITFHLTAVNVSLSTAEQLEAGVIGWSIVPPPVEVNSHLLAYLEVVDEQGSDEFTWHLHHKTTQPKASNIARLTPFNRISFVALEGIAVPFTFDPLEIRVALYLLAKDSPPYWFEMQFFCKSESDGTVGTSRPVVGDCKVTRVTGRRPLVSYKYRK